MKSEDGRLEWIQALRGIAALMIVFTHDRFVLDNTATGKVIADAVMMPLAAGVDLFFMISGFIMVLSTSSFDGTKTYACKFLAKRIARIWPAYMVATLIALMLLHHGINAFHDKYLILWALEGLAFIPHNPSASPIYLDMFIPITWTLCYEFYFYVVFASSMLLGKRRYYALTAWFILTLIIIPILLGSYSLYAVSQPTIALFRIANIAINPIIWDFIIGMLAAWMYKSRTHVHSEPLIYIAMATAICALAVYWQALSMSFHGPAGWGTPVAVLFFGFTALAKVNMPSIPKSLIWLGSISYSLYLTHIFSFTVVARALHLPETSSTALFVLRPFAAIILAWMFFRFIESPLSKRAHKLFMEIVDEIARKLSASSSIIPAAALREDISHHQKTDI